MNPTRTGQTAYTDENAKKKAEDDGRDGQTQSSPSKIAQAEKTLKDQETYVVDDNGKIHPQNSPVCLLAIIPGIANLFSNCDIVVAMAKQSRREIKVPAVKASKAFAV